MFRSQFEATLQDTTTSLGLCWVGNSSVPAVSLIASKLSECSGREEKHRKSQDYERDDKRKYGWNLGALRGRDSAMREPTFLIESAKISQCRNIDLSKIYIANGKNRCTGITSWRDIEYEPKQHKLGWEVTHHEARSVPAELYTPFHTVSFRTPTLISKRSKLPSAAICAKAEVGGFSVSREAYYNEVVPVQTYGAKTWRTDDELEDWDEAGFRLRVGSEPTTLAWYV
ncbi:hypothetical protein BDP27DRAFT_1376900 [Rhodocollybia butyracea]|uniref:Uncharacterized protein n=1 Tax=Rhodocollybia butyracea TaxID=206335 RepID=A0A9P5P4X3_9AGAR|nr:hypothetical protein BDP27DRAFT_1376900 [Rhodocollybia butyracea]